VQLTGNMFFKASNSFQNTQIIIFDPYLQFSSKSTETLDLKKFILVTKKQQKAMNRVLQRLKSVAEGECPMDEISDWTMETDDVDKFLYHTEEGYSKKELKKWDGKFHDAFPAFIRFIFDRRKSGAFHRC
jgi:hypothetical protein